MAIPLRDWLMFGPEWVSSCGDSRLLASRVPTSAEVNGVARKSGACRRLGAISMLLLISK